MVAWKGSCVACGECERCCWGWQWQQLLHSMWGHFWLKEVSYEWETDSMEEGIIGRSVAVEKGMHGAQHLQPCNGQGVGCQQNLVKDFVRTFMCEYHGVGLVLG